MTMITVNRSAPCTASLSRFSVLATIAHFYGTWRQRQALKSLDNAALNDIGITRTEADAEANRPIWDAPDNWRC